jgi:hypothetical protein
MRLKSFRQAHKKDWNYNLNYKLKNWIKTSALEAEKAISFLPVADQDYFTRWYPNFSREVTPSIQQLW